MMMTTKTTPTLTPPTIPMADELPTPTEEAQRALVASFIKQANQAGLKVKWHNPDIVVIGIVKPTQETNDKTVPTEGGEKTL
jgi:hypothetical protein